jgi:adenine-specific DNA-methyltransferase
MHEVSSEKLRGGFYTPDPLVDVCFNRVAELCKGYEVLRVLEPSVGDGAFLRRLAEHPLCSRVESLLGIEIAEAEAEKARQLGRSMPFEARIYTASTLDWANNTHESFDVVVGNPPFVRFQFVSESDLRATEQLGRRLGLLFRGVSNLWIPVLLSALDRLRPDGVMALVVPAEIFTGFASGDARAWLLSNFKELRIDMFEPGSFPNVLQEVVVISGRRTGDLGRASSKDGYVQFAEHFHSGLTLRWAHYVPQTSANWTRYLLTPMQLEALATAKKLPEVQLFGNIAKFEVSIVTGANDFFSVNNEELSQFQLHAWAKPLLPRIRHADDLVYTLDDHEATATNGHKAWLLDFSDEHPDPLTCPGAAEYIRRGELQRLNSRYKTSIREPWYRVPSIRPGKLLLSKRSHRYPRLVFNAAGVLTTDTIYRGNMLPLFRGRDLDLVAAFHNSLTFLTAEIEGRSFGGGVLELVPSEIARLSVPFPKESLCDELPKLREAARDASSSPEKQEHLISETDKMLARKVPGLTADLMSPIQQARELLLKRRLSRN